MTDAIKPLYTAHGTATGGRNGHSQTADKIDQRRPLGAEGDGRPRQAEHDDARALFAAGYAACFGGALDFIAKPHKKDASKATANCAVNRPARKGGFGLVVELEVTDPSLPTAELQALAVEAHETICPYAMRRAAMSTSRSSPTGVTPARRPPRLPARPVRPLAGARTMLRAPVISTA